MMRIFFRLLILLFVLFAAGIVWAYFAAWRSPDTFALYKEDQTYEFMNWQVYEETASEILPPYILQKEPLNNGAAFFFGAEHGRVPGDPQYRLIRKMWDEFAPSIALVEGRLGFLLPYLEDPTEKYGESGFVAKLARSQNIPYYSWELSKQDEISSLLKTHTKEQVALFIILRPYWGSVQTVRLPGADEIVTGLIEDRGARAGIEGTITSIADIDRIWARDFPDAADWRDQSFGVELPGYFGELFIQANDVRDTHMLNTVMSLTEKGERVYVSAGWSHIVRIQSVLEQH
ncbi:MAG: hypothetical protein MRY59_04600 [Aquisalinus sp.]|nr:hypothetical protein [Aquisalinus sp.]